MEWIKNNKKAYSQPHKKQQKSLFPTPQKNNKKKPPRN